MFAPRPFLKIGFSCASVLLLVTANASAHDSKKSDSQSYRIAQVELDLASDVRYLKSHGVENFGDFSSFGRDDSSGWENSDRSGKSSKDDSNSRFSFGRHDGWHFEFADSRHDDHGHDRGNNWGDGSFGGGFPQSGNGGGDCNGGGNSNGGDPICGGNPTCGGGDPNGGGNPGGSATPEPRASVLSVIAAGAMALLLVGRNVRRRASVNRG